MGAVTQLESVESLKSVVTVGTRAMCGWVCPTPVPNTHCPILSKQGHTASTVCNEATVMGGKGRLITFLYLHAEMASILHKTWCLDKNRASAIIHLIAWGTGLSYKQGGEEYAKDLLNQQHGAVHHARGRYWILHPDNAIMKGLCPSATKAGSFAVCTRSP